MVWLVSCHVVGQFSRKERPKLQKQCSYWKEAHRMLNGWMPTFETHVVFTDGYQCHYGDNLYLDGSTRFPLLRQQWSNVKRRTVFSTLVISYVLCLQASRWSRHLPTTGCRYGEHLYDKMTINGWYGLSLTVWQKQPPKNYTKISARRHWICTQWESQWILRQKYQGIALPSAIAVTRPICRILIWDELLDMKQIGVLWPKMAVMKPHASVRGLMRRRSCLMAIFHRENR